MERRKSFANERQDGIQKREPEDGTYTMIPCNKATDSCSRPLIKRSSTKTFSTRLTSWNALPVSALIVTRKTDMRAALVIGHPGHELLVHGWLEATHPLVFVFTDGSGRTNESRLASTTSVLNQAGAKCGSIYGRLTDAAAYAAILNHEFDFFANLASELSEAFVVERINCVAGDAFEGYNPLHDVCRLVINAAATVAQRLRGYRIGNFEVSLVGERALCHQAYHTDGICRVLDDAAFARKMAAAKGYAELAGEVHAMQARTPTDALKTECLRPVDSPSVEYSGGQLPFYEYYGEKQVAAGHYHRVIRYHDHIAPLAEALRRYAESRT
jgi:hypothetical protein